MWIPLCRGLISEEECFLLNVSVSQKYQKSKTFDHEMNEARLTIGAATSNMTQQVVALPPV